VSGSIDDPTYWQERAEESRAMAEQLADAVAKAAMLKVADSYEHLALKALERLALRESR
jgi:hypothetical protein